MKTTTANNDVPVRIDCREDPTRDPGTLNNLMASSVAALCSRLCTHPLDTLKTRVQVSNAHLPLLPTFLSLLRNGGLYRGLPIALALSAPGLSVYLTAYDLSKDSISRHFPYLSTDSVVNHMASAVIAEVSSGLFWTPMEVLKSKQQVENVPTSISKGPNSKPGTFASTSALSTTSVSVSPFSTAAVTSIPPKVPAAASKRQAPVGTMDLARRIYRQEGLLGFYRGYFITLGVFVPYSMIYFATYEQLKDMAWRRRHTAIPLSIAKQHEETPPFPTIVACAAVAAGIAGGVSNIVDVVKTRWQISVLATTEENASAGRIIRHMLRQGGFTSFTRGMGARVLWMIPSVTISMSMFEYLKANGFV
ncbi:mitochondrial carrier domain-containing protein [Gamsiella multidivaricata]|uniref:mitochondrial carrier domain-containing protein n=1 Tax=Gamsiella multidivaricata TaxID=101098 RepID=UPI00221E8D69|nr:mitochondrial carrier domain-containing protein [Gamsiella multidivaricata]KAI7822606.1 mitochondrial carrier domain-containing protein [Gamsiella multidivaricata]